MNYIELSAQTARQSVLLKTASLKQQQPKMKFGCITALAHELKTPLNAVEGCVDIIGTKRETIAPIEYTYMISRRYTHPQ